MSFGPGFGPGFGEGFASGEDPPVLRQAIPNITERKDSGGYSYNLSSYFLGADTYAIAPAVEAGWSFDTNTGVLQIDTDALGLFGPFVVTATNVNGDTDSNGFTVEVVPARTGAGRKKKRRRLIVEIDGQNFEVSTEDEAVALLEQARQLAVVQVEKARSSPVRVNHGIQRPRIVAKTPELKPVIAKAKQEIASLYDDAIRDLEIRALIAKADEDEEEALLRFLI